MFGHACLRCRDTSRATKSRCFPSHFSLRRLSCYEHISKVGPALYLYVPLRYAVTRFEKMYRGQSEGGGSVAEQVDDLRERMRLLQGAFFVRFL